MHINIFGGSGSGTTTLGAALSERLGWMHLDTDDFYWEKTDATFTQKVLPAIRKKNLLEAVNKLDHSIISGSLVSWGREWPTKLDLAVFLYLPPEIRMDRLRQREKKRFGDLLENPLRRKTSLAFLSWAAQYDDPSFYGRNIKLHQDWAAQLSCPVREIKGDLTVVERVERVLEKIS